MSKNLKELTLEAGHTYGVAVQLDGVDPEETDGRLQFAIRAVESVSFTEALRAHLDNTELNLGGYNTVIEVIDLGETDCVCGAHGEEAEAVTEQTVDELLAEIAVVNRAFTDAKNAGLISEASIVETFAIEPTDFDMPAGSVYQLGTSTTLTKVGKHKWVTNNGKLIEISDEILAITALGREDFKRVA